jgi:hypothetical protein
MALAPSNSVLSNPLNAPNADTQTDTSSLYDWISDAPADAPTPDAPIVDSIQSDIYKYPDIETNSGFDLDLTTANKQEAVTAASLRKKLNLYDMSTYDVYNQQLLDRKSVV